MFRVLTDGVYEPGTVRPSLSPSMDIQVASNFERALFEASNRDADWTRKSMEHLSRDRRLVLPEIVRERLKERYGADRCDDEETLATIRKTHEEAGRTVDPHTAVALHAAYKMNRKSGAPVVVLSTAHPAKFPDAVARAIGAPPPVPDRLKSLFSGVERVATLPNNKDLVRAFIESKL